MKKFTTAFVLVLLCVSVSFSQERVKEKDVKGEWKMVFDINFDEMEEDLEEDTWFGWVFSGALTGLVEDVLGEIDIQMKFMDNGKLKITVNAYGEEDIDYAEWYINSKGQLVILDEDDHLDDDEVWMMEGKDLVSYEKSGKGRFEKKQVYLKRL